MATVLRRLRLKRVSLVDTPANQEARVVLFKSADGETTKQQPTAAEVHVDSIECKKCGASMSKGAKECGKCGAPMNYEKAVDRPKEDEMDEKMKADLDAANAKLADATARIEALTKERDALQKSLDTPEAIEKRKLEALPASIRERIEKQDAEIKKLHDKEAESEMVEFVKTSAAQLPGEHAENGKLLKRVKDVVTAEDFEALSTILKAASAQIEKGGLFKEIGKDGQPAPQDQTVLAQIERAADEMVAKNATMKREDAIAAVLASKPELYKAYSRSVTLRADMLADAN